jgi:hypothetical protein
MKKLLLFSSILLGTAGLANAQQGLSKGQVKAQLQKKNAQTTNKKTTQSKTTNRIINGEDQQPAEKIKVIDKTTK